MELSRVGLLVSLFGLTHLVACGDSGTGAGGQGGQNTGGEASGGGGGGTGLCPAAEVPAGCTPVSKVGAASTLYSISGVGFEFEPAMDFNEPDVIVVTLSNTHIGQVPLGSQELNAYNGVVWSVASIDAVTDLINADPAAMDGRLFVATSGTVDIDAAPDYGTQFKGLIAGSLCNVAYREVDLDLEVIEGGDCLFLAEGTFDASAYDADCAAPVDVANTPSGGACMQDWQAVGHNCNPVNNEGCTATQICDFGGYFQCYDVVGDEVGLCEACDNLDGPLCGVGLTCDSDSDTGRCHRYCCQDADCGPGASCVSYAYVVGVGVCLAD